MTKNVNFVVICTFLGLENKKILQIIFFCYTHTYSPSFSTPSASPMPSFTSSPLPPADNAAANPAVFSTNPVTPSPVAFTNVPEPTVKRPTPQLSPKFVEQKVEEVKVAYWIEIIFTSIFNFHLFSCSLYSYLSSNFMIKNIPLPSSFLFL